MIKGNTSIKIGYFLMAVGVVVFLIGGIGALNYSVGVRNKRNSK